MDFTLPPVNRPLPPCPQCKQPEALTWTTGKQGVYCQLCDFMHFKNKRLNEADKEREDVNSISMHIDDWNALIAGNYVEGLWTGRWQAAALVGIPSALLGAVGAIIALRWVFYSMTGL